MILLFDLFIVRKELQLLKYRHPNNKTCLFGHNILLPQPYFAEPFISPFLKHSF